MLLLPLIAYINQFNSGIATLGLISLTLFSLLAYCDFVGRLINQLTRILKIRVFVVPHAVKPVKAEKKE